MPAPPASLELPIGGLTATSVDPLPSVPSWRHAVSRGRPDISLEHIMGEHRDPAASPGQGAIVLHGISKRFGSNLVHNNISFGIAASEVVVLLSANGAGKRARELRWQPTHRRSE